MDWLSDRYRRFAVWGLGRSGVAAANLLVGRGRTVIASDSRSLGELDLSALAPEVDVRCEGNVLGDAQVVITSPGLPPHLPVFERAAAAEVPVVAEIELAQAASPARWLAVTGTDGKTTTTSLLGAMIAAADLEHVVAGNIGTPLCEVTADVSAEGWIVAEVSAFQLWSTHAFRADVAGLTNLAADHLDYYRGDIEAYARSKRTLIARAVAQDAAAFNLDDARVASWRDDYAGQHMGYSLRAEQADDALVREMWRASAGELMWREDGETHRLLEDLEAASALRGDHNALNVMCASLMARAAGVPAEAIVAAIEGFTPLAHRCQEVGRWEALRFVDDSKATNAHAALAGLMALREEPALAVIVGGVDKGLPLEELADFLAAHATRVVLIGELRERLSAALGERVPWSRAESMEEAVAVAAEAAGSQGVVSLSPACSSFDMFDSYAHRGEVYQEAVAAWIAAR